VEQLGCCAQYLRNSNMPLACQIKTLARRPIEDLKTLHGPRAGDISERVMFSNKIVIISSSKTELFLSLSLP
jgi:hypothetical protein